MSTAVLIRLIPIAVYIGDEFFWTHRDWHALTLYLFSYLTSFPSFLLSKYRIIIKQHNCYIYNIKYKTRIIIQPAPRSIRNRSKKFDKNITKRGNVHPGKVAEREEENGPRISPTLIIFFLVIVVGSSLVQVFNMFLGGGGKPPVDDESKYNRM
jgi:hypothetical protein